MWRELIRSLFADAKFREPAKTGDIARAGRELGVALPAELADLYISFDDLLFFGADGGGDQFAYRILDGGIPETSGVYRWNHETDSRHGFAADLRDYFRRSVPKDE